MSDKTNKKQTISAPIVAPEAVTDLLDRAVVLDARTGDDAEIVYQAGHVRGAIRVDLENDLSTPCDPSSGGRHPLPAFAAWLQRVGAWGIGRSTPVVIYDAASGGMAAARAWWMLRAIGHESVAVVDGGWPSLVAAGVPVEEEPRAGVPRGPYPTDRSEWPSVDADLVDSIRDDGRWRLVDARAPERYRGDDEPLDPIAGHIPGAINLFWKALIDPDGRLLPRGALMKAFDSMRGDVPSDRVVCYCGSGVTACQLVLAMDACGLEGARLYVGSWSEWCRQGRPVARDSSS
jgi:thiosulfate/3-mercaptopyruvate sulfurtransferase